MPAAPFLNLRPESHWGREAFSSSPFTSPIPTAKRAVEVDERYAIRVAQSEENILACASNPLGERWWMLAAKPWRFLAACFEWRAYRLIGPQAESRLPITVDGTCNGFQHLSALLLDSKIATATNLAPCEHPHDLYQEIARPTPTKDPAGCRKWEIRSPRPPRQSRNYRSQPCEAGRDDHTVRDHQTWDKGAIPRRKVC